MNAIGKNIKTIRQKKSISPIRAAEFFNMDVDTLLKLEESDGSDIIVNKLFEIAVFFDVNINDLLFSDLDNPLKKREEDIKELMLKIQEKNKIISNLTVGLFDMEETLKSHKLPINSTN